MRTAIFLFLCTTTGFLFYCGSSVSTAQPDATTSLLNRVLPNEKNKEKPTTVVAALMVGNAELATSLLKGGADPNVSNPFGDTALIWSINSQLLELTSELLIKGALVDHAGSYGKTALHWAAKAGSSPLCDLLLAHGAKTSLVDEDLDSPLIMAAEGNHDGVIRLLLDKGAAIHWTNTNGETALIQALRNNAAASVETLILRGADVEQPLPNGQTAMVFAMEKGLARLLLTPAILEKFPDMDARLKGNYQEVVINQHAKPRLNLAKLSLRVHELVNQERAGKGLSQLDYDPKLEVVAQAHSHDMSTRNFFNHVNPDNEQPRDRAIRANYKSYKVGETTYKVGIGENIFKSRVYAGSHGTYEGTKKLVNKDWHSLDEMAKEAVTGWMSSPGHRANILLPIYEKEAIGIYINENEGIFITQNFF